MDTTPIILIPSVVDEELYNAIIHLLPQVTRNKPLPTWEYIDAILSANSSTLLVARYPGKDGSIVGMLTLVLYKIPSGIYGQIEDVVVELHYRRKGIGRALLDRALILAKVMDVNWINLTSNPTRVAANQLYLKIGFKQRDTNVYYIEL